MKNIVDVTKNILLSVFIFLIVSPFTEAITINEICPVSDDRYPFEWVEIFNNSDEKINLNDFSIEDKTGKKMKWQGGELEAHQFMLATASSTLNNDGDTITLYKNTDSIDTVSYTGQYSHNESYVRCPDGGDAWNHIKATSPLSSNNSNCLIQNQPTLLLSNPSSSPSNSPHVSEQTYTNVYVSEVYAYPQDNEQEWVELYNANPFSVVLQNWILDDIENGGSTPFSFSITVPARSFGVVAITKTMFNNSGDTIRLLDGGGNEKDILVYATAQKEKSIGRMDGEGGLVCIQNPTKGTQNSTCLTESTAKTTTYETPSLVSSDPNAPLVFDSLANPNIASNDALMATQSYYIAYPSQGEVKGTKSILPTFNKNNKDGYKTAQSFASTSVMFSWTNICYILIKLFKKYKLIVATNML